MERCTREGDVLVVEFNNACKRLCILHELAVQLGEKVIWSGNPNVLCTLRGNDDGGKVIEEFLCVRDLVCANDRAGTRVNMRTELSIALTPVRYLGCGLFMQRSYSSRK